MFLERHVTGLYRRGASWEVQRKAGGSETFDAVILTMPVPQILQLQGDVGQRETHTHLHRYTCGDRHALTAVESTEYFYSGTVLLNPRPVSTRAVSDLSWSETLASC